MKVRYFLLIILILVNFISAETTFFDNPDEFIIFPTLFESGISEVSSEGTETKIEESVGCRYEWDCTEWSRCFLSKKQTRTCINMGTCPDNYNSPKTLQNCSFQLGSEGKISIREIITKSNVLIYFILVLVILYIMFYLERNFLKKHFLPRLKKAWNKLPVSKKD